MQPKEDKDRMFQPIEDTALLDALNALGRSINIIATYGTHHPAFKQATESALAAMQTLFIDRKKINLGAFNGVMTVDEVPVSAAGTLLKSLERRLVRLRITGLRIARGISETELAKLAELLANKEAEDFNAGMSQSGLSHITTEATRFQAVREGQTVANESDLAGAGGNGILVLEDDLSDPGSGGGDGSGEAPVHVEQIVAFLQGDLDVEDGNVSEELTELASDPAKLGQMIMESVAIRQSATELSGESLGDIVLGCLRRTYDGLRKQPAFQTKEGTADLQKALLLLEENMLEKMRDIAGGSDPELDRQIVQTIREMEENLGFELAANQYMEHREGIEASKRQMKDYAFAKGADAAEEMISNTGIPSSEWRRIVVESRDAGKQDSSLPIAASLDSLATVFEKLESLMKSSETDGREVEDLLGQANNNLGDATHSTKEKLDSLSKQLYVIEEDTGTIGGHAQEMDRKALLSSIAEIAQELMQPLTAINASLEMLLNGYAGEVAPDQRNLLSLASCSGDDLNYLMKELIGIVGIPVNRGVDKRFVVPHE
ncbi:MAG: hypothetical protein ABFR33_05715 [Verrucomicrobiota bacterium]